MTAGAVRHLVRAVHRDPLGVPAAGAGVRVRDDLLAAAAGLARGRACGSSCTRLLLAELNAAGALDWSRAVIDSSHLRALKGGPKRARARSTAPGPARSTT